MIAVLVAAAALVAASPAPDAASSPAPAGASEIPILGAFVRAGATLDAAARGRLPVASATAIDPDKSSAIYGGTRLADVLHDAGAAVGDAVRGPAARAFVVVRGADGYGAVYSLAETQGSNGDCAPLVAGTRNGAPLALGTGPYRMVASCDLTHARWVRGIASITIVVAP